MEPGVTLRSRVRQPEACSPFQSETHPRGPSMQSECAMSASSARRACFSTSRRVAITIACALVALGSLGCGDGGITSPDSLRDGTGSVSASGAVSARGDGVAFFQSIGSGNLRVFQLVVAPETNPQANPVWMLQIASAAGRPSVGTYQLSPLSGS